MRAVIASSAIFVFAFVAAMGLSPASLANDYQTPPPSGSVIKDFRVSTAALADISSGRSSQGAQQPLQLFSDTSLPPTSGLAGVWLSVWNNAPQVLEAKAEMEATGYEVAGARTGYYPSLEVNAAQGDNETSSATLSIIQPLWDGGLTRAQVAETRALQDRAAAQLGLVKIETALEAAEAYLQLAMAEEASALWQTYLLELDELTSLVRRRADKGVSPRNDIELARVRFQQANAGAAGSRGREQAARSRLAIYIEEQLVSAPWPTVDDLVDDIEVEALFKQGVPSNHPLRLRAVHDMRAQQARGRATRAALWPSISLQHVHQLDQQTGDFTPDNATLLALQFQSNQGLRGYRAGQAQAARVKGSWQAVENANREIADRIQAAIAERDSARLQFQAYASAAKSSAMLVESNLRRFKVGRKSWLEVLNARRESHEAASRALELKREFWLANSVLALQATLWRSMEASARPATPVPENYDTVPVSVNNSVKNNSRMLNSSNLSNTRSKDSGGSEPETNYRRMPYTTRRR